MEVQVSKKDMESGKTTWVAFGWSMINLFTHERELNSGIWRLPLY